MLKSKKIDDFVPTKIWRLRPGEPVPSDIHLYFKSNSHIMLWRPMGTVFTPEMLEKYTKRGIEQVWVHKSDWEAFMHYLNDLKEGPAPTPEIAREEEATSAWESHKRPPPPPAELIYTPRVSARDIELILESPDKSDREKRALAARASRELLGEMASPENLEEQDIVRRAIAKVIEELVSQPGRAAQQTSQQIWKIAAKEPELCHGVNVATTAVLFSLAFGRIERDLLADIALAGLIHDVGMTLLPYQLSQGLRESLEASQMERYLSHTEAIPELISLLSPEIPERAGLIARHHHEPYSVKFPSPVADLAQLITMADIVDSICGGQWDGRARTFSEGLSRMEEMEKETPSDRRIFNPDVFSAVLRWIRSSVPEDALAEVTSVVTQQVRSVQGGER